MGAMKVWDGSAWQTVAPFSERASVFVGPSQPAGATYAGDLWWDTDDSPLVPGEELAYNEITANVNVTATAPASAQLAIEGTTRSYDGSPIMISFYAGLAYSPSAAWIIVQLWDDVTDLGTFCQMNTNSGYTPLYGERRMYPTVGTHNYRIKAYMAGSGTGIIYATSGGAGNNRLPAFIRVTRV